MGCDSVGLLVKDQCFDEACIAIGYACLVRARLVCSFGLRLCAEADIFCGKPCLKAGVNRLVSTQAAEARSSMHTHRHTTQRKPEHRAACATPVRDTVSASDGTTRTTHFIMPST
eukprot:3402168-Pleurochrysis_carterae.AAC.1